MSVYRRDWAERQPRQVSRISVPTSSTVARKVRAPSKAGHLSTAVEASPRLLLEGCQNRFGGRAMRWRLRFFRIPNLVQTLLHLEKQHRRELFYAALFAVVCAVVIEVGRPWWVNHQRDQATRRILRATATLFARDRNNQVTAVGMGIFISPDGTLITNRHVVTNGGLEARLSSGAFYDLKATPGAIRSYREYDFTILQFEGTAIPYVDLGKSASLRAREQILALIPQPTFLPTLASGFVSDPRRAVGPPIDALIEITASVTRSIPNGGLFDDDGHVLGFISNQVVPPSLQKEFSTLFAIPIDRLKPVITGREKQARADSADSLYSLGILAENRKNFDEATHYFQQAIAVDPHYANAYFELGGIDYENGDFDAQLAMYQKAARYAPQDTDILYYLATAYEDKGLYDDAIGGYLRVLKLKPDHKDSLYQLGILYMTRGEKSRALTYATQLQRLDPGLATELELILTRMR